MDGNSLFKEYERLIHSMATKYKYVYYYHNEKQENFTYDDVFQVACIGFTKAVNGYDVSMKDKIKFSSFAVLCMKHEIECNLVTVNRKKRTDNRWSYISLQSRVKNEVIGGGQQVSEIVGYNDISYSKFETRDALNYILESVRHKFSDRDFIIIKNVIIYGKTYKQVAADYGMTYVNVGIKIKRLGRLIREQFTEDDIKYLLTA